MNTEVTRRYIEEPGQEPGQDNNNQNNNPQGNGQPPVPQKKKSSASR